MKVLSKKTGFISLIAVIAVIFMASCKTSDTVAPKLILLGDNPMTISLNAVYVEPGATANDNKDGDITSKIVITNPISLQPATGPFQDIYLPKDATIAVGTYTVTYTVKDAAGNTTTLNRTVNVQNDISPYAINYSVHKINQTHPATTYPDYESLLTFDPNINNRLWFAKFSNLSLYSFNVYANVRGDSIFIPLQTFPSSDNYNFRGNDQTTKFAGILNRNQYKFEILYQSSSNSTSAEIIDETYTKKY
ncbi:MAG: DUF5011 domain-containing protein [Bacteroidia bacterium]|nr:DUF5011 domain-containing protein [Bacteroidia bacterium]